MSTLKGNLTMLDKAIEHGKEHRKQYRGSKVLVVVIGVKTIGYTEPID